MKLFVQVPCLNEAQTLPAVLATIPDEVPGFTSVEVLVIDDGCTDRTVEVAREHGVRHFVRHRSTMGLARSFRDGVDYALANGADVVVTTDGDNQYPQERIPDLVAPIVAGSADIVVSDRQTRTIEHFSTLKRWTQRVGSAVVNRVAETDVPDAASGFRAYSAAALRGLNVVTPFSFTMETIIQAGNKGYRIAAVPVVTNPKTRESRLFSHPLHHVRKSSYAIMRSYVMFKPHVVFGTIAAVLILTSAFPLVRFVVFFAQGDGEGHLQSLVLASALFVGGLLAIALLVIADLLRTNRILLEDALERLKRLEYDG